MTVAPFHVLEGEVRVWYGVFDLKDGQDMSLSFVGVSPNWVEVGNGLQVTCKYRVDHDNVILEHTISVHLEAWTDEPSEQGEQWDETCDLLIDWTSGTVYLDTGTAGVPELQFTFGFPTVSQDYRLRVYRRYQPRSEETKENAVDEDRDAPHHQERYLFQFWPVPSTYDVLNSEEEPATEPATRLSSQEKTILTFMARGISDVAIAKELKISLRTVKTSIVSIYHKLEVKNQDRTAAIVAALRRGWIFLE